eukprot:CAMPEP_0113259520 /NCGR_PEP_ID=MMETSP0008_2-20120614/16394_1 /TAXON_ID=97485 /ORGANISM="Prymnesium parvum" /LENGTH=89 /DNA_ID=CAMNT_0000108041 /DNA_START=80 /DNA_END=349 /DNA_ORIENTATION=+ /assembly_acc=CAM_ASM_000153
MTARRCQRQLEALTEEEVWRSPGSSFFAASRIYPSASRVSNRRCSAVATGALTESEWHWTGRGFGSCHAQELCAFDFQRMCAMGAAGIA